MTGEAFKIKYDIFLEIAESMTQKFGFLPLLFGSVGLEKRLDMDLEAHDIDILIPEKYLLSLWDDFELFIKQLGFELYDLHEHTFTRNGIRIAFASIESLKPFADIDISEIPTICAGGCRYLLLDLRDYLKVYLASSKDNYRADKSNSKDSVKIGLIRKYLSCQ